MKSIKFILTLLAVALLALPAAQARKKVVKAAKLEPAKVDTVSIADFSYALGVAQTEGLKGYLKQRFDVDTTDMSEFIRGLQDVMADLQNNKPVAYSAGVQIGRQVYTQMLPGVNQQITGNKNAKYVDVASFNRGFLEVLAGTNSLKADSAAAVATRQMEYYTARLTEQQYGKNREEGQAFLKANAKNDSVKTLPSGLQYKVLVAGTGEKPQATDRVKVNYEGKLLNGTVFDSSYKRGQPMTFACNQVIKGWTEALTNMSVGSTWMVYIPESLGYGSRQMGSIPPLSTLIFKIELLSIEK